MISCKGKDAYMAPSSIQIMLRPQNVLCHSGSTIISADEEDDLLLFMLWQNQQQED